MRSFGLIPTVRPLAGMVVALGLAACSALTSLDGLTSAEGGAAVLTGDGAAPDDAAGSANADGGSNPPASADGSGGDADGGAPLSDSASVDSSSADSASPTADASGAGSDATSDAGASPYCASLFPAPLFCDDFDEGTLAAPWDQITGTNGTVTLSNAVSVSPPTSMFSAVKSSAAANNVDVAAYKSFPAKQGVAGIYTMAFDVRVDAVDTSSSSDGTLGAFQLWNGSAYWDLQLEVAYLSATGDLDVWMTEDDATSNTPHHATAHLPMKTWTRVAITITLPTGSGGATPATISFDGTMVASAIVHVSTNNPIPEAIVGMTYATPASSGWAARYDNVTFD